MNEVEFVSELRLVDQSQPEYEEEEKNEDDYDNIRYQLVLYEEAIAIFNFDQAIQLHSECKHFKICCLHCSSKLNIQTRCDVTRR